MSTVGSGLSLQYLPYIVHASNEGSDRGCAEAQIRMSLRCSPNVLAHNMKTSNLDARSYLQL